MEIPKHYFYVLLLFGAATNLCFAEEKDKTELELGLGVGGIDIPHYRGSDQRSTIYLPFPYVKYSSKRLKVDREGGRYYLYERGISKLDVSMGFAFPVDSEDNDARQAMPDLKAVVEIGPRWVVYPYTSEDKRFRIRVALPLRMAFATNIIENDFIGWTATPYLQFRYFHYAETTLSLGPLWASEKYHDYFYQVDTKYVTTTRPFYDAKGGYSGSRISFSSNRRFSKTIWGVVFARYDFLKGANFEDSPLVKQDTAFMFGLGVTYIFNNK